jgi:hypothetical protein
VAEGTRLLSEYGDQTPSRVRIPPSPYWPDFGSAKPRSSSPIRQWSAVANIDTLALSAQLHYAYQGSAGGFHGGS